MPFGRTVTGRNVGGTNESAMITNSKSQATILTVLVISSRYFAAWGRLDKDRITPCADVLLVLVTMVPVVPPSAAVAVRYNYHVAVGGATTKFPLKD
jgi:hypothetical protein